MRLIDADWLEERFGKRICVDWADDRYRGAMQDALCEVLGAPNIDAVPVVRCVDCKHRCTPVCLMYHNEYCDEGDGFYDDYYVDRTDDDGFCHLGERWDGEAGCGSI